MKGIHSGFDWKMGHNIWQPGAIVRKLFSAPVYHSVKTETLNLFRKTFLFCLTVMWYFYILTQNVEKRQIFYLRSKGIVFVVKRTESYTWISLY